jgi:hypothetical protein
VDIHGGETLTTPRLLAYAHWLSSEIQSTSEVRCINATEGGILAEGTELMSLKEVLFRHCQKEHTLWERIPEIESRPSNTKKLEKFVRQTLREISSIQAECKNGLQELDQWVEEVRQDNPDSIIAASQRWWAHFQKRAFHFAETARILEFFNQRAIQEFLRTTLPDEMNADGIYKRYYQFVVSILDCSNYLEAKFVELKSYLGAQTPQLQMKAHPREKERKMPKSSAQ